MRCIIGATMASVLRSAAWLAVRIGAPHHDRHGGFTAIRRCAAVARIPKCFALLRMEGNMILGDTILETRGLTREFKGFTAVNGVNLRVRRGSIHALIGPNGAGKTTCFNLLTKFLVPTAGQIVFNGIDITGERPAQIARRGIIRSFQISAVFPHLTALQNVRIGLQRALGTAFHFWKSERTLHQLDDHALDLLTQVGPRRFRRRLDGRTVIRPQARARNRHHARDGTRIDVARRADARHGATKTSTA